MLFFFFAYVVLLPFCSSQEISCTIDVTSGGIRYRVPEFRASRCLYAWSNEANHTLANKDRKLDELVVSSNITEIVTYKCYKVIKYRRSCISEKKNIRATCNTTYTENLEHQHEDGKTNDKNDDNITTIIIIPAVVSVLLLLLLIIIPAIGIMVYRRNIPRGMKERYAAVDKNNQPANVKKVKLVPL